MKSYLLLCLFLIFGNSFMASAKGMTSFYSYLDKETQLEGKIFIDGQLMATLDPTNQSSHVNTTPASIAMFSIPENAQTLKMTGSLVNSEGKKRHFDHQCKIVDIGVETAALHDDNRTVIQRLQALFNLLDDDNYFEENTGNTLALKANLPTKEFYQEIEKRLNVTLPEVIKVIDQYDIEMSNEGYFVDVKDMGNVLDFLAERSFPEDFIDALSADSRVGKLYQRSLVAYFFVGDGYEMLAWDPQGQWFWVHDHDIYSPVFFKESQKKFTDEDVVVTMLASYFLGDFMFDDNICFVDSAHPRGNITISFKRKGFYSSKLIPIFKNRSFEWR
ncbi:hypothetical protein REJ26_001644 [Providencia stuartii]|uniref:hypothetical protein n=1 Tax=Providencia TaxID=586 RepID=UPI00294006C1|nr:hypothetical protein [Providencia sp. 2023EL-00965]ELR5299887.1 hypothetical protein [Providencia stuartii]MDW7589101.1 hypothetical protein [Providencia sp. 2023EL-00965]